MQSTTKRRIERDLFFLGGLAAGARLMYMFDPDRGARRRAMARDRAVWCFHQVQHTLDRSVRDLSNRVRGAAAEVVSEFVPENVDDAVLLGRVRAKLGRAVSHPGAVDVAIKRGVVTLKGAIFDRELQYLLWAVRSVRGVVRVENRLSLHDRADVPDLQGEGHAIAPPFELLRDRWKPATRMLVGTAGLGLAAYGLVVRRDLPGALLGFLGLGAMARTAINQRILPIPGIDDHRRGIELQKTVHVNAPVEAVFQLMADPVKFPAFMSHVHEVKLIGDRRYHWTISGPLGTCLSWEAEVSELVPNQRIAWRSLRGSAIDNAGVVQFQEDDEGGTRVHIRLSYHPPAGIVSHTLAEFLGADPKAVLDEDMVRLKALLEQGRTRVRGHQVTLAEVAG